MKALQAVAVTALIGLLVGCQSGTNLGGLNRCDAAIEVDASDYEGESLNFDVLAVGARSYLKTVPEDPESVFLFVRRAGSDFVPAAVAVPEEAIDRDSDVSGVDWLITISGELCPE